MAGRLERKEGRNFSEVQAILRPDALPTAASELSVFYDGFKGKDQGPVYLRLRVITKFENADFIFNCNSWMKSNKCSIMKCPVQTENATDIRWLPYTTHYSH